MVPVVVVLLRLVVVMGNVGVGVRMVLLLEEEVVVCVQVHGLDRVALVLKREKLFGLFYERQRCKRLRDYFDLYRANDRESLIEFKVP